MPDDLLPKGAVPEDEMMALAYLIERLIHKRGVPLDQLLDLVKAFATDATPDAELSPSDRANRSRGYA